MFSKKGQGTTEYLIILAVIIVIALVVVGVMGWIPGLASGITESQSRAYWASASPVSITDYEITAGGTVDLVLRNQTSQTIDVNTITIGTNTIIINETLIGGAEKTKTGLSGGPTGTAGDPYSHDITISYSSLIADKTQIGAKPLVGIYAP